MVALRWMARVLLVATAVVALAAIVGADSGPADYALLDRARRASTPLRPPASGAEVVALQNVLAGVCFRPATNNTALPPTGAFDGATETALKSFQVSHNVSTPPWWSLTGDPLETAAATSGTSTELGFVGPQTMQAFDVALGIHAQPSPGLLRITDAQVNVVAPLSPSAGK